MSVYLSVNKTYARDMVIDINRQSAGRCRLHSRPKLLSPLWWWRLRTMLSLMRYDCSLYSLTVNHVNNQQKTQSHFIHNEIIITFQHYTREATELFTGTVHFQNTVGPFSPVNNVTQWMKHSTNILWDLHYVDQPGVEWWMTCELVIVIHFHSESSYDML